MISLRKVEYKVLLKSGHLTREKFVSTQVEVGQKVTDIDGRVFRVLDVIEVPRSGTNLSELSLRST